MTGRVSMVLVVAMLGAVAPAWAAGVRTTETRAELVGLRSANLARLDSVIEAAIRNGATPGAALAVGRRGQIVRLRGYGRLTYAADAPAVTDSTLFDLASLTKVVATTTAIMVLVDQGRIELDVPIHQYLRLWPSSGPASDITLRHLLTHTSGLPAGADLWTTSGREAKVSRIANMKLAMSPGTQTIYSDVGMIVTAAVLESITGERLDDFVEREVFAPLRLRETMFNPSRLMIGEEAALTRVAPLVVDVHDRSTFFGPFALLASWSEEAVTPVRMFARADERLRTRMLDATQVAPTEFDTKRGSSLRGVVHDRNAAALDGVGGHAGLFSSARDMAVYAQLMLNAAAHNIDMPVARASTVNLFVARSGARRRALGWDMPTARSSAGDYFSAESFGHTGFTGTSIWVDPKRDVFVVLLTNRLHPSATNQKHIALRRAVHDEVELAIADEPIYARTDVN